MYIYIYLCTEATHHPVNITNYIKCFALDSNPVENN